MDRLDEDVCIYHKTSTNGDGMFKAATRQVFVTGKDGLTSSTIVQFIYYFWSFEISVNILRNQK